MNWPKYIHKNSFHYFLLVNTNLAQVLNSNICMISVKQLPITKEIYPTIMMNWDCDIVIYSSQFLKGFRQKAFY